jgi:septal ring factor EnvC (AmiA/AmiB activator)
MKIDDASAAELDSLKQLESRIGKILDRHEEVRREKDALARQLREKEEQFGQLVSQVRLFEQERREVKTRLEKILGRLNGLDIA